MARAAENDKGLNDLFEMTLKDIYFAEKQIVRALPKMAKAAQSPELKKAFEHHLDQSQTHVERLEEVFEAIGKAPRGKTCDAIMGILEEGKEVIEDFKGSPAIDAGLISAAQAVEHYEITRYGTLATWASQLGYKSAVTLLKATLAEEEKTDKTLSQLAIASANIEAQAA